MYWMNYTLKIYLVISLQFQKKSIHSPDLKGTIIHTIECFIGKRKFKEKTKAFNL